MSQTTEEKVAVLEDNCKDMKSDISKLTADQAQIAIDNAVIKRDIKTVLRTTTELKESIKDLADEPKRKYSMLTTITITATITTLITLIGNCIVNYFLK